MYQTSYTMQSNSFNFIYLSNDMSVISTGIAIAKAPPTIPPSTRATYKKYAFVAKIVSKVHIYITKIVKQLFHSEQ